MPPKNNHPMDQIKYLLDENVTPALRTALQRLQSTMIIRVVGDPDAPKRGTLDPEILAWCELQQFSLVTNNRASMPTHLHEHIVNGQHVPGVFVLHPHLTLAQTSEDLAMIWGASNASEYEDQIRYLPLSR